MASVMAEVSHPLNGDRDAVGLAHMGKKQVLKVCRQFYVIYVE
jgi:hypothetical protein